ncbi:MAG: acyl-CoA carboxylase subunit epsilon [Actinomycetota bacterium]|nr:acyl-CoA carboxylase subunit epsilon [Actinomycetota bacterium]
MSPGHTLDGSGVIRIRSGNPTAEEIAAAVVAAAALSAVTAPSGGLTGNRSLWNVQARVPRPRLSPGPGAWRASALPR